MAWGNNNDFKMCQECRALIPANAARCEMCGAEGHYAARQGESSAESLFGQWPVTMALMLVNLVVYALVLLYQARFDSSFYLNEPVAAGPSFTPSPLVNWLFGSVQSNVRQSGEWWRLVTYGYLHGDLLHIGMNCFGLWQAGRIAEEIWGRAQYFMLYVLAGIGGGLVVVFFARGAVGASGSLFGLIAALALYGYRRGDLFGKSLQQYTVSWLLYGLAMSFSPRVSMAGHVGGAVAGALFAWLMPDAEKLREKMSLMRVAQMGGIAALVLVLSCGGLAARNIRNQEQALYLGTLTERVLDTVQNQWRRDRLWLALGWRQSPAAESQAIKTETREQLEKIFPREFSRPAAEVSDAQLKDALKQAVTGLCSDAGTLRRMPTRDEASAQIFARLAEGLDLQCAPTAAFNTADAKLTFTTAVGELEQNLGGRTFQAALRDYVNWLEFRANTLRMPLGELLSPGMEAELRRLAGPSPEKSPEKLPEKKSEQ